MNSKFLLAITGAWCLLAASAHATTTFFTNQSEWQQSSSDYGVNPLTTINLTTATYVNVVVPEQEGDDALTLSLNAAPFPVTFDDSNNLSGYFPFPTAANGSVTSPIERRNALIITFGAPIYAFGGVFDVPIPSPYVPELLVGIANAGIASPGFDGFTSDIPFTQVLLFNDGCSLMGPPSCGADISISDIQVSTVPTPEPDLLPLFGLAAFVLIGGRSLIKSRRAAMQI